LKGSKKNSSVGGRRQGPIFRKRDYDQKQQKRGALNRRKKHTRETTIGQGRGGVATEGQKKKNIDGSEGKQAKKGGKKPIWGGNHYSVKQMRKKEVPGVTEMDQKKTKT